jgi:hypothetical protein
MSVYAVQHELIPFILHAIGFTTRVDNAAISVRKMLFSDGLKRKG